MRTLISLIGFVLVLLIAFFLVRDFSTLYLMSTSIDYMFVFFGGTVNYSILINLLEALILVYIALAFLSAFGATSEEKRIPLIATIIGFILSLFFFHFSIFAFLFGIGLAVSSYLVTLLANTYYQELGRWRFFRTGARSVASVMIIVNICIALSIYLTFSPQVEVQMKERLVNQILSAMHAQSEEIKIAEQMGVNVTAAMKEKIESMSIVQRYTKFMKFFIPLFFWLVLEMLRTFLSLVSGIVTSILLRIYSRVE